MKITNGWLKEKGACREKLKKSCWNKLNHAIKKGVIGKPKICSNCNKEFNSRGIQAHHEDYTKPYYIKWLCISCHDKLEALLGNRKNFQVGYDKRRIIFKKGHNYKSGCFKKGYDPRRNIKGRLLLKTK